jgi:hypothetical protein
MLLDSLRNVTQGQHPYIPKVADLPLEDRRCRVSWR